MRRDMRSGSREAWYCLWQVRSSPNDYLCAWADGPSQVSEEDQARRVSRDVGPLAPHNVSPPPPAHEPEPERITAAVTFRARLSPTPAPEITRSSPPPRSRAGSASPHSSVLQVSATRRTSCMWILRQTRTCQLGYAPTPTSTAYVYT